MPRTLDYDPSDDERALDDEAAPDVEFPDDDDEAATPVAGWPSRDREEDVHADLPDDDLLDDDVEPDL